MKVKNCPFCGDYPRISEWPTYTDMGKNKRMVYIIRCEYCHVPELGSGCYFTNFDKNLLVKRWNTRKIFGFKKDLDVLD